MSSPFQVFRKHQKILLVVLVGLSMLSFVIFDTIQNIGDISQMPPLLVVITLALLLGAVAWVFGINNHKSSEYGTIGLMAGVAIGLLFVFRTRTSDAVTLGDFQLSRNEMTNLVNSRFIANRFVTAAIDRTHPDITDQEMNFRARQQQFGFGHPEEQVDQDVILGELLRREGEKVGMTLPDSAVHAFIQEITDEKMLREAFKEIRTELRASESDIVESLKQELLARQAAMTLYARIDLPPAVDWKFSQRLQVRQTATTAGVPTAEFIDEQAEPPQAELSQLFDQYNKNLPGFTPEGKLEEGRPGFYQPPRIKLAYVTPDYQAFEKQVSVTDEEVQARYNRDYVNASKPQDSLLFPNGPLLTPQGGPSLTPPTSEPPTDAAPATPAPDAAAAPATTPEAATPPAGDAPASTPPATDPPAADAAPAPTTPETPPAADAPPATTPETETNCDDAPAETPVTPATTDTPATPAAEAPAAETPATPATDDAAPAADAAPATPPAPDAAAPADAATPPAPADAATPPADGAIPTAPEPAPPLPSSSVRPLDDTLKLELREQLLREKTNLLIEKAMADATEKIRNEIGRDVHAPPGSPNVLTPADATQKVEEYAAANNFRYVASELLSYEEMLKSDDVPVAQFKLQNSGNPFQSYTVADELFSTTPADTFRPRQGTERDRNGQIVDQAIYWKLQHEPGYEPTDMGEERVRNAVIKTWRELAARTKAEERSKALAEQVRSSDKPMLETLADVTVTGAPMTTLLNIMQTGQFAWMRQSIVPAMTLQGFDFAPVRSTIPGIEQAGDDFMKVVFDELKPGDVGVAPSADRSIYYVVKIETRIPATEEEWTTVRNNFLSGEYDPMVDRLGADLVNRETPHWANELFRKYDVQLPSSSEETE